jgi:MoaA/NifB/PqqE/SkfB family radical SAM enzyme
LKRRKAIMIEYQELVDDLYNSLKSKCPSLSPTDEVEGLLLDEDGRPLTLEQPLGAQLEITSRCDLKCLHCYNNSRICPDSKDLSDEEWLRLAEELKDMKLLSCTISGGEPFLRSNLLQALIGTLTRNEHTLIGVITNGWFVNQSFIDFFGSLSRKWIQVSIDGAYPEEHDWLRGVEGSWKRAVKTAYSLSRAGIPIRIAHTCNKKNFKNLEKMLELSVLIGCRDFVFTPVLNAGRAFLNREHLLLDEEDQKQFGEVVEHCIRSYSCYMKVSQGAKYPDYYVRYVNLPTLGVLVRPDGKVKIDCSMPVVFGNVREGRLREIWDEAARYGWQNHVVLSYIKRMADGDFSGAIPYVDDDLMWDKSQ